MKVIRKGLYEHIHGKAQRRLKYAESDQCPQGSAYHTGNQCKLHGIPGFLKVMII